MTQVGVVARAIFSYMHVPTTHMLPKRRKRRQTFSDPIPNAAAQCPDDADHVDIARVCTKETDSSSRETERGATATSGKPKIHSA